MSSPKAPSSRRRIPRRRRLARQPRRRRRTRQRVGALTRRLANEGERLELVNNSDRLMNTVEYDNAAFAVAADGSGTSLAKLDPDTESEPARKLGLQHPRRRHARPHEFPRQTGAAETVHPAGDQHDLGLRPVRLPVRNRLKHNRAYNNSAWPTAGSCTSGAPFPARHR